MRSRLLQDFMALRPDAREVRKALAVKLVYQGYLYDEIQTILDVSRGSITAWKQAYEEDGIDGLRLNYKGRKSYLLGVQPGYLHFGTRCKLLLHKPILQFTRLAQKW
jgi:LPS sulfotransferase NodH